MLTQIFRRIEAGLLVQPVLSAASAPSLLDRLSLIAKWGGHRVAQHWRYRTSLHQLVHLSDRELRDIGIEETPWERAALDEARRHGTHPSHSVPAPWSAPDFVRTEHRAIQTAVLKAKAREAASDGEL